MSARTSAAYGRGASSAGTNGMNAVAKSAVAPATARPYQAYRRAPRASPIPKSCEEKDETMNTVPIGRMKNVKALSAPAVVAARAAAPRWATITASAIPTTTCEERETTMGHASARSARSRPPRAPASTPSAAAPSAMAGILIPGPSASRPARLGRRAAGGGRRAAGGDAIGCRPEGAHLGRRDHPVRVPLLGRGEEPLPPRGRRDGGGDREGPRAGRRRADALRARRRVRDGHGRRAQLARAAQARPRAAREGARGARALGRGRGAAPARRRARRGDRGAGRPVAAQPSLFD